MMWRKKPNEPTPRVDPEGPPVPVLSEGEVLWSADGLSAPAQVVAYVTKTADTRRAEMEAWATSDYLAKVSDEMIYKSQRGWLTTSREFLYTDKPDAIAAARAELAKAYAHLNEKCAQIDAIEETF